jgi:hypothetical protein
MVEVINPIDQLREDLKQLKTMFIILTLLNIILFYFTTTLNISEKDKILFFYASHHIPNTNYTDITMKKVYENYNDTIYNIAIPENIV